MKHLAKHILTGAALLLALTGCERAEPTSYLIPKETRETTMPGAATNAAEQAPRAADPVNASKPKNTSATDSMRLLPGMEEAADQAGEVNYIVPTGWQELAASGIRKANLRVTEADGSAELTVLVFPGDVGGRLANINRWRAQIGLDEAKTEDLPAFTESYIMSAHPGLYVRLEGETQSILGGLLPFHGSTWFFKLQGDTPTVLRNEAAMKTFLDSIKIEDTHH